MALGQSHKISDIIHDSAELHLYTNYMLIRSLAMTSLDTLVSKTNPTIMPCTII